MYLQNDLVMGAAEELRQALTDNASARGREWAIHMGQSLSDVEKTLRRHEGDFGGDDESLADKDRALLPSPGVHRRLEGLRQEPGELIEDVRILRTDLGVGRDTVVGYAERAHHLLHALERLERGEIDLVQESITADIGAGD
jgi:hypothetical protein